MGNVILFRSVPLDDMAFISFSESKISFPPLFYLFYFEIVLRYSKKRVVSIMKVEILSRIDWLFIQLHLQKANNPHGALDQRIYLAPSIQEHQKKEL